MSAIKTKKAIAGAPVEGRDLRSLAEIWYSLPEAGQAMLLSSIVKKGCTKVSLYKWISGKVPHENNMKKLIKSLRECFAIYPLPYTLFPGTSAEERRLLAERFKEQRERLAWDGRVKWPSLDKEEDEEERI